MDPLLWYDRWLGSIWMTKDVGLPEIKHAPVVPDIAQVCRHQQGPLAHPSDPDGAGFRLLRPPRTRPLSLPDDEGTSPEPDDQQVVLRNSMERARP